jgi:hypothetical protein
MNPKVVPLPRSKLLTPAVSNTEQPKEFRFNVTWDTLLAFPQPVEITETTQTAVVVSPAVVIPPAVNAPPTYALQVVEPPRRSQGDEAAWEMVVPKMVRK